MSLTTDLKMLFLTIKIIFMKESTEGIQEGQVPAMDNNTNAKPEEKKSA